LEGGLDGSGLPGQKKRKVQEVAETVDKSLFVDSPVEEVSRWRSMMRSSSVLCVC
jgi:hypothetical protein